MVGLFASRWRGSMSCGLMIVTCASLLATPAQASTSETMSFAQTALVTHWSLPLASPEVGSMPEPAFASALSNENVLQGKFSHSEARTEVMAAPAAEATTRRLRQPVGADGPSLPAEDLEARGVGAYDREQPYRTPGDIKALEVTFQLLNAADAITTVVCLNRDDCHENNPVYGRHPKPIVVVGAKAAVGVLHYLAMRSLLPDNPGLARALGWISVAIQGTVVGLNVSQLF